MRALLRLLGAETDLGKAGLGLSGASRCFVFDDEWRQSAFFRGQLRLLDAYEA